ncbi:MAG: 1,4-alpha-glucan branching enzyme, partial [Vicinamibacterales bacterium]
MADAALTPELAALVGGQQRDPFSLLGPHPTSAGAIVIRAIRPDADRIAVRLVGDGSLVPMRRLSPDGLFEVSISGTEIPDYRLEITLHGGHLFQIDDPYRYGRVLTEYDLYLLGEGTHYRAFEKLGAHRRQVGSTTGVHFAVWAPNAQRVSVVGDFNRWDGRTHAMRHFTLAGIWELFVPNLADGEKYKFEIRTAAGHLLTKTDPFGFAFEHPPQTASVVRDVSRYQWQDEPWMSTRQAQGAWLERPMSIYEVHL